MIADEEGFSIENISFVDESTEDNDLEAHVIVFVADVHMTLPKHPGPLSESEQETLSEKFADHEISDEQRERQEKYQEKLEDTK